MVFDTDIISDDLRGRDARPSARLNAVRLQLGRLTVSAITIFELFRGLHKSGMAGALQKLEHRLDRFNVLPVDSEVAKLAGEIDGQLRRRGFTIGAADPMIAASAILHGGTLITGNTAHFMRVADLGYPLILENWGTNLATDGV